MIPIGLLKRLLRLLGILRGIPESLRVSAGLQLLSGITRLELGLTHNLVRLMMMMIGILKRMGHNHDRFSHSVPASAPREHPRCEFEEFFSTSEVTSSAKPILTLYSPVDEILNSCMDRATRFAKESKPLHSVLPFKRKATPVGNRPDFCMARYVNTDFSRISRQKKILRYRASSMTV